MANPWKRATLKQLHYFLDVAARLRAEHPEYDPYAGYTYYRQWGARGPAQHTKAAFAVDFFKDLHRAKMELTAGRPQINLGVELLASAAFWLGQYRALDHMVGVSPCRDQKR